MADCAEQVPGAGEAADVQNEQTAGMNGRELLVIHKAGTAELCGPKQICMVISQPWIPQAQVLQMSVGSVVST